MYINICIYWIKCKFVVENKCESQQWSIILSIPLRYFCSIKHLSTCELVFLWTFFQLCAAQTQPLCSSRNDIISSSPCCCITPPTHTHISSVHIGDATHDVIQNHFLLTWSYSCELFRPTLWSDISEARSVPFIRPGCFVSDREGPPLPPTVPPLLWIHRAPTPTSSSRCLPAGKIKRRVFPTGPKVPTLQPHWLSPWQQAHLELLMEAVFLQILPGRGRGGCRGGEGRWQEAERLTALLWEADHK